MINDSLSGSGQFDHCSDLGPVTCAAIFNNFFITLNMFE